MGTTTPNIGLYIPADGETNYGTSFSNGMLFLDSHDHSGAPHGGVPLSASGLAAGSVTRDKLNANVFGIGVHPDANNAIEVDGILKPIFQLGSNGLIVRTGATTAAARTITASGTGISITNGDGVAGNPTISNTNPAIWNLIQSQTASGATVSFTGIPSTYNEILITFDQVLTSIQANHSIGFSTDNGATYAKTARIYVLYGNPAAGEIKTGAPCAFTGGAGPTAVALVGYVKFANPNLTMVRNLDTNLSDSDFVGRGVINSSVQINAVQFSLSGGATFSSGTIAMYGM